MLVHITLLTLEGQISICCLTNPHIYLNKHFPRSREREPLQQKSSILWSYHNKPLHSTLMCIVYKHPLWKAIKCISFYSADMLVPSEVISSQWGLSFPHALLRFCCISESNLSMSIINSQGHDRCHIKSIHIEILQSFRTNFIYLYV